MPGPVLEPPVLFISDVHLGGFSEIENSRIESELIGLLDYCQSNNIRLAILGDLFDYWMEYPGRTPNLGTELLARFEKFNNQLGPTLYITGNHDNWTRDHLAKRGFYLEHEHHIFSSNDKKIMLLHGDGLSHSAYNFKRPLLHRILRSDVFVEVYQGIFPAKVGITLMKYFSRMTRKMDWNPNKEKILNRWAEYQLKSADVDIILCGHDHMPRMKQFSFGTYINLGTFYDHRTMVYNNKNGISLVSWEPGMQTLKNFEQPINE